MSINNILSVIEKTAAKTEARREARKLKGNATSYLTIWNDAVSEKASDGVAPTLKTLAMLKRAMSRLTVADPKRRKQFLEWSVENWVAVGQRSFRKSGSFPETPDLPFFVAAISTFYKAYCAKDTAPVLSKNTDKELQALRNRVALLDKQVAERDQQIERLTRELSKAKAERRKRNQENDKGLSAWD